MTNRYPLILDAADKKLKELPIGDSLKVDGNISVNNGSVIGSLTGNVTGNVVGNLTGIVTGDVIGNLSGSVFADDSVLLVDGINGTVPGENITGTVTANVAGANGTLLVDSVNNSIPYSVISGTPVVPTDVSQLTDNQEIIPTDVSQLADSQGILQFTSVETFLDLLDTPNLYSLNAGKYLKVNQTENALEFGEINQQEIEVALGYTPYNGATNSAGFLTAEADTLQTVTQRGATTTTPLIVSDITSTSNTTTDQTIKNSLEFFNNNLTNEFAIVVENNKLLTLANRVTINTSTNTLNLTNCDLIGDANSSIGLETNYWTDAFVNTVKTGTIIAKSAADLIVEPSLNVVFALGNSTRKVKVTGIGALQLPNITTSQRNTFTPEVGDIIYNSDVSSVQMYVAIAGWTGDVPPNPIPGWITLYTAPPPP